MFNVFNLKSSCPELDHCSPNWLCHGNDLSGGSCGWEIRNNCIFVFLTLLQCCSPSLPIWSLPHGKIVYFGRENKQRENYSFHRTHKRISIVCGVFNVKLPGKNEIFLNLASNPKMTEWQKSSLQRLMLENVYANGGTLNVMVWRMKTSNQWLGSLL